MILVPLVVKFVVLLLMSISTFIAGIESVLKLNNLISTSWFGIWKVWITLFVIYVIAVIAQTIIENKGDN